jgi:hypothetical protein
LGSPCATHLRDLPQSIDDVHRSPLEVTRARDDLGPEHGSVSTGEHARRSSGRFACEGYPSG